MKRPFFRGRHGGVEKRGGRKTSRMTPPPKRGFGPPSYGTFSTPPPPQVSVLCFSCTKIHDRAEQKLFWRGPRIFGRARSLVRFPPPHTFCYPPISWPKVVPHSAHQGGHATTRFQEGFSEGSQECFVEGSKKGSEKGSCFVMWRACLKARNPEKLKSRKSDSKVTFRVGPKSEGRKWGVRSVVVEFGVFGAPRFSVQRSPNPLKIGIWGPLG